MRKTLVSFVFILLISEVYCQKQSFLKPDYDLIKLEIQDSVSIFYYPQLMGRMVSFDTTLNVEDYKYLYYGYLFQKDFEPFMTTFNEDKLLELRQREVLDTIKIFDLANHLIADFPFDLNSLRILRIYYRIKGDSVMSRNLKNRYFGILEAIYSSGDGSSKETAIHVISVNHELEILRQKKLKLISQSKVDDFDCLTVQSISIVQGLKKCIYFYTGQISNKNLQVK